MSCKRLDEIDVLLTFAALCLFVIDVCVRGGLCLFLCRWERFLVMFYWKIKVFVVLVKTEPQMYLVASICLACPLHDLFQTLIKERN